MRKTTIPELLLRLSIAFSFLYPPVSAFFHPFSWIGYFPKFVLIHSPVSAIVLLHIFGVIEIILALWILSGKKIFIPSILAAIILAVIVAFNFSQMDVVFRDVSLCLVALSLALKNFQIRQIAAPENKNSKSQSSIVERYQD